MMAESSAAVRSAPRRRVVVHLRLRSLKSGGGFQPWAIPNGQGRCIEFDVDDATDQLIHAVSATTMMRLRPRRETRPLRHVVKLERCRATSSFKDVTVDGIGTLVFNVNERVRTRMRNGLVHKLAVRYARDLLSSSVAACAHRAARRRRVFCELRQRDTTPPTVSRMQEKRYTCAHCGVTCRYFQWVEGWQRRRRKGRRGCGACRAVLYCGRACQWKDWKEGGHRETCVPR